MFMRRIYGGEITPALAVRGNGSARLNWALDLTVLIIVSLQSAFVKVKSLYL